MYRWLAPTSDLVPKHSKFSAAAGGVVLLDDRVLLVKESSVINFYSIGCSQWPLGRSEWPS